MSDDIQIRELPGTWVVRAGGAVLGETRKALELSEGSLPPVVYFPRADLAMAMLDPSPTRSTCPKKGEAVYFSIQAKSGPIQDAGWSYETPLDTVSAIAGHIAFFADKATVEEV
ncbi:MAG TPA: hypothetical protein DIU07_16460 [Rhodobacteraceae bacterium]|nr:hypothetical protein [Paracoccaceae bacterium]